MKDFKRHIVLAGIIALIILGAFPQTPYGATQQNGYFVQVGVFRIQTNAQILIERLEKAGLIPVIEKDGFTTVYIGPYKTYSEAEVKVNKLKTIGLDSFIKKKTIQSSDYYELVPNESTVVNTSNSSGKYSKNVFLESDVKLIGIIGSHTLFVPVDEHWKLGDDAYVNLVYKTPVISEYEHSTITVYLNDTPVKSFWIDEGTSGSKSLRIPLDKSRLRTGFNEVKFLTYHRLTDDLCEDDVNQANWVLLEKGTYVHIEYEELPDVSNLSDFPYPFIKESRDVPVDFVLTLPSEPTEAETSAAIILAAYAGKTNRYKNVNLSVESFNEADKTNNNLIHICNSIEIPKSLKGQFSEDEIEKMKSTAIIKKLVSPFNSEKRIIVVASENDKALLKAVKALSISDMVEQMENESEWIREDKDLKKIEEKDTEFVELKELGYGDILFRGAKRGSATVSVEVPQTWKLKEDAKILVKFRYSDIVDCDKSSLSIFMNDVPAGSKQFDEINNNDDTCVLKIPKEVIDDKFLMIRFEMSIMPEEYDCKAASYDKNLWGYISNETVIYLSHQKKESYSFDEYPAPFIERKKANDLVFVMPDSIGTDYIQNDCNIMAFMGHEIEEIEKMELVKAVDFGSFEQNGNMIVIGTPESNSMIKELNEKYNISYENDWLEFEDFKEIKLLDYFRKNVGTLQIIESPYNSEKMILIVSGPNEKTVEHAVKFLTTFELFEKLYGNTAFISESGALRTGYVGQEPESKKEADKEDFDDAQVAGRRENLASDEIKLFVAIAGSTFILMMLFLVYVTRKRKRE